MKPDKQKYRFKCLGQVNCGCEEGLKLNGGFLLDDLQLALTIFIPLVVSVVAWSLTYIIPYVWPDSLSKIILFFTQNKDPTDPIEIRLLINQFLKYDDWKRLIARDRIKRMFIHKLNSIQIEEIENWNNAKKKITNLNVKDYIDLLTDLCDKIFNHPGENKALVNFFEKYGYDKDVFNKNIEKMSEIYQSNNNAKIWFYCVSKYMPKNFVSDLEKLSETDDVPIFLMDFGNELIDHNSTFDIEQVLKAKAGLYPPKIWSNEEINNKFNDLIIYIDYPHGKSKKELIPRFSLGLSKHEKSSQTILGLISEVDREILNKDMEKFGWNR